MAELKDTIFTYIISSDFPNKKEVKEVLAGNDMADAIVTFMECIAKNPKYIFSLTYYGNNEVLQ